MQNHDNFQNCTSESRYIAGDCDMQSFSKVFHTLNHLRKLERNMVTREQFDLDEREREREGFSSGANF